MAPRKLDRWEGRLRQVLDRVDHHLEDTYSEIFPRHPNRPPRGGTANVKYDGLFSVEAKYTAGFGSHHGEGYTLDIRLATMASVPAEVMRKIEEDIVEVLKRELPLAFPGRTLDVTRDGNAYKIQGDLSLRG